MVTFENVGTEAQPIIITQQEFMRRMKDMAAMGGGCMMSFYGDMPDSYSLVVNTAHPLVEKILKAEEKACEIELAPVSAQTTAPPCAVRRRPNHRRAAGRAIG